jgi:hypothetical protein
MNTVKTNPEVLWDARKEAGQKANAKKMNHVFISLYQNAEETYNTKTFNKSFENVGKLNIPERN